MRERIMTQLDMLLEYLAWVDKELGGWKPAPRCWIRFRWALVRPYLECPV